MLLISFQYAQKKRCIFCVPYFTVHQSNVVMVENKHNDNIMPVHLLCISKNFQSNTNQGNQFLWHQNSLLMLKANDTALINLTSRRILYNLEQIGKEDFFATFRFSSKPPVTVVMVYV